VVDSDDIPNDSHAIPPNNYKFKPKAWKPMPQLSEAPVFKPTEEEFQDPMKYISSIRDVVKKFGVCKIVPPSNAWLQNKPFTKVVNPKTMIFQTKLQTIHQLQTRSGTNERFLDDLKAFLKQNNQPMHDAPIVDGQELDLYKLYTAVMSRGGLQAVVRNKRWGEIVKELKIGSDLVSAANLLRKHYYRYVYNYEFQQSLKRNAIDSMSEKDLRDWENASPKEEKKDDDEEFGYGDGKMFTLTTFKKYANAFKKKWFDMDEEIPPEEIENAFWRIVENCEDNVQVHYGSDLDVSNTGSGFPNDPEDLKQASGWNLNIFAKWPGSLLSYLHENIGGVTIPMMYVGMLFSAFCWHTEDNNLYSINYLHHGAPKTWYGIPASSAEQFEKVMRQHLPELFAVQPDLLHHLVTMLSPRILLENNVPVYHMLQEAGEFVLTFPNAYHAGFSHGFNCAESTNFALPDWLPFGRDCLERYRFFSRSSVFSFEKLICNAALANDLSPEIREAIKAELPFIKKAEQLLRQKVFEREGTWKSIHFDLFEGREGEIKECDICKYDCYLSAVTCPCSPDKVVCLRHSDKLCKCDPSRRALLYRWKLADLDQLLKRFGVENKKVPELDALLDKENIHNESGNTSPTRDFTVGRGHKGSKKLSPKLLHTLVGTSKPAIRKLARLDGVKRLKKVDIAYDESENMSDLYTVEKVLDRQTIKGKSHYLIKWAGFPASESTWLSGDEFYCPGLFEGKKNNKNGKLKTMKSRNMAKVRRKM